MSCLTTVAANKIADSTKAKPFFMEGIVINGFPIEQVEISFGITVPREKDGMIPN